MQGKLLLQLVEELRLRFLPTPVVWKGFNRGIDSIWTELEQQVHDGAYEPALKRLRIETNTLPTVERVRSVLEVEGKKAMLKDSDYRDREWTKTKEPNPRRDNSKPGEAQLTAVQLIARDEHAKLAIQGFLMMQRNDKTHKEKLEFFKLMASRYPHLDWAKEGLDLQKWYQKRDLLAQQKEAKP